MGIIPPVMARILSNSLQESFQSRQERSVHGYSADDASRHPPQALLLFTADIRERPPPPIGKTSPPVERMVLNSLQDLVAAEELRVSAFYQGLPIVNCQSSARFS